MLNGRKTEYDIVPYIIVMINDLLVILPERIICYQAKLVERLAIYIINPIELINN